jgi:hypothetical protein
MYINPAETPEEYAAKLKSLLPCVCEELKLIGRSKIEVIDIHSSGVAFRYLRICRARIRMGRVIDGGGVEVSLEFSR